MAGDFEINPLVTKISKRYHDIKYEHFRCQDIKFGNDPLGAIVIKLNMWQTIFEINHLGTKILKRYHDIKY